jgi:hypothetical protein
MDGSGSNFDLNKFVGLELTCFVVLEGQGSFAPGLPGSGGAAKQVAGGRPIKALDRSGHQANRV